MTKAAKLMGCLCILSGISPVVAQIMVELVIEISVQIVEVNTTYSLNDELWIIMCYSAMLCVSWLD